MVDSVLPPSPSNNPGDIKEEKEEEDEEEERRRGKGRRMERRGRREKEREDKEKKTSYQALFKHLPNLINYKIVNDQLEISDTISIPRVLWKSY